MASWQATAREAEVASVGARGAVLDRAYEALVAQLRDEQAKGLGSESDYVFTSLTGRPLGRDRLSKRGVLEQRREQASDMSPRRRYAALWRLPRRTLGSRWSWQRRCPGTARPSTPSTTHARSGMRKSARRCGTRWLPSGSVTRQLTNQLTGGRSEWLQCLARERKAPPSRAFLDGAYRDRTGDLRLAKPALSQLS